MKRAEARGVVIHLRDACVVDRVPLQPHSLPFELNSLL